MADDGGNKEMRITLYLQIAKEAKKKDPRQKIVDRIVSTEENSQIVVLMMMVDADEEDEDENDMNVLLLFNRYKEGSFKCWRLLKSFLGVVRRWYRPWLRTGDCFVLCALRRRKTSCNRLGITFNSIWQLTTWQLVGGRGWGWFKVA